MKNKDFTNINYLKRGNIKQQNSYKVLKELDIFNVLRKFNPILVGTIPINIDIENSDLDIVCEVYDFKEFQKIVEDRYSMFSKFHISNNSTDNETILTVNFYVEDIEIGLDGNPYDELLKLEEYSDKKIKDMLDNIRNS